MNKNLIGTIAGVFALGIVKKMSSGSKSQTNVSILPTTPINASAKYYPSFFTDYDGDGIFDVDDPNPYEWDSSGRTVEQVLLSKQMENIIDYRNSLVDIKKTKENEISSLIKVPNMKVYGRTKTPYSIIQKLRKTQMAKLRDLIGLTIAVDSYQQVLEVVEQIKTGLLGKVVNVFDHYKQPMRGYRAMHIIMQYGNPHIEGSVHFQWEIQVKTKREAFIGEFTHEAYKRDSKDPIGTDFISRIACLADMGNEEAINIFDEFAQKPKAIEALVYKDQNSGDSISVNGVVYTFSKINKMLDENNIVKSETDEERAERLKSRNRNKNKKNHPYSKR